MHIPLPFRPSQYSLFLHSSAVFLLLYATYSLTAFPTIALEDDGVFVLTAFFNGIEHPPGYPLFTLIGNLFTHIPIGTVAYRVHLVSALFGAATCSVIWLITFKITHQLSAAYCAALALGFSSVFWSQSLISEVYTLNTFLFFTTFLLCLLVPNARTDFQKTRLLVLIGFVYGLGLSNHWPLLILASPLFVFLLWPHRSLIFRKSPFIGLAMLAGLLPYAWMVIRSQMNPVINFGGEIDSMEAFLYYVSRKYYAGVDSQPGAGWFDKIQFIAFSTRQALAQFTPIGFLIAICGLIYLHKLSNKTILPAIVTGILCTYIPLHLMLGFNFDEHYMSVFSVYPLIPYGLLSIALGAGSVQLIEYLLLKTKLRPSSKPFLNALALTLPVLIFSMNFSVNNQSDNYWARDYAHTLLTSLPQHAIMFVNGDIDMGTIGYFNLVEKVRPDITIYSDSNQVFNNRLSHLLSSDEERDIALQRFIAKSERPIFFSINYSHPDYRTIDMGFYYFIDKSNEYPQQSAVLMPEFYHYYMDKVRKLEDRSNWFAFHRDLLAYRLSMILGKQSVEQDMGVQLLQSHLPGHESNYYEIVGFISGALELPHQIDHMAYMPLIRRSFGLMKADMTKEKRLIPYLALAFLYLNTGQYNAVINTLKDAITLSPDNISARLILMEAYTRTGNRNEYEKLHKQFPAGSDLPRPVMKMDKDWEKKK